jgi:hypothetical protein
MTSKMKCLPLIKYIVNIIKLSYSSNNDLFSAILPQMNWATQKIQIDSHLLYFNVPQLHLACSSHSNFPHRWDYT